MNDDPYSKVLLYSGFNLCKAPKSFFKNKPLDDTKENH